MDNCLKPDLILLGRKSDDPGNVDWIPTVFTSNKENALKSAAKREKQEKRFQLLQAKRARALSIRQATELEEAEVEEPCNLEPDTSPLKKMKLLEQELTEQNNEIAS